MKRLALLLILITTLDAFELTSLALSLESNIIPQIILMQREDSLRKVGGEIVITIVSEENAGMEAKELLHQMRERVSEQSHDLPIKINTAIYGDKIDYTNVSSLVLFPSEELRTVANAAGNAGIITFSVFPNDLRKGALVSVSFTDEISIVVNKKQMIRTKLVFKNDFYTIAKIKNPDLLR